MAETYPIDPVVRLCGVTARSPELRERAISRLVDCWGECQLRSPSQPMAAGGYYTATMGEPLAQEWVALGGPADPAELADWKHQTNDWERIAKTEGWDRDVDRPINLDCGYVTQAKWVLATTKNRSHRIYLRRSMFAEITLTYVGGQWRSGPHTYANYQTPLVAEFATRCRNLLRRWIQSSEA